MCICVWVAACRAERRAGRRGKASVKCAGLCTWVKLGWICMSTLHMPCLHTHICACAREMHGFTTRFLRYIPWHSMLSFSTYEVTLSDFAPVLVQCVDMPSSVWWMKTMHNLCGWVLACDAVICPAYLIAFQLYHNSHRTWIAMDQKRQRTVGSHAACSTVSVPASWATHVW